MDLAFVLKSKSIAKIVKFGLQNIPGHKGLKKAVQYLVISELNINFSSEWIVVVVATSASISANKS